MQVFRNGFIGLLIGLVGYVQAAEWKLCVLVDGSEQMVISQAYDAVLSALDTQIRDARKQQSTLEKWDVEIIATGITKPSAFSGKRHFMSVPLFPAGEGLDSSKRNNRIPNVTKESPVTYAEFKGEFHKFISEKNQLNAGVIIISDQPEVSQISDKVKFHKNILVEFVKNAGDVVPRPDRQKISSQVKSVFDSFFAYVNASVKLPIVSVSSLGSEAVYVNTPVRFQVKGSDLSVAVINFGDGTPVLKIEQAEIDRTIEHSYAGTGKFTVEVTGSRDAKTTVAKAVVAVVDKPLPPVIKITVASEPPLYVGRSVKIQLDVSQASEATLSFGDGSATTKYVPAMARDGVDHEYMREGDFVFEVAAQGPGGQVKKQAAVSISPLPKIDLQVEAADQGDGAVVAVPKAEWATSIQLDFTDGAVVSAKSGDTVTHTYTSGGAHEIKMTVMRQGKQEVLSKQVTVKKAEPPPAEPVVTPPPVEAPKPQPPPEAPKPPSTEPAVPAVHPVAAFILETSAGEVELQVSGAYEVKSGEAIDFLNKSKNALKYRWTFGDDSEPVTERSPSHIYEREGTFEAVLTAYGDGTQSSSAKVKIKVTGASIATSLICAIVGLGMIGAIWFLIQWNRRPELTVMVSINGQDGPVKAFGIINHRIVLSELSTPLDCRAKKVDDLWKVEFRAHDDRVLEQRPSHTPLRLEAKTWTQPLNLGEYAVAGKPNEIIKVQGL